MEIAVFIIMVMVSFSFLLKLTCYPLPGRIAVGLLAAVFVIFTYDAASSQSKTQIEEWLENTSLMLDISVLLTVDVAFQIVFCVLGAKAFYTKLTKTENIVYRISFWIPGLLIFPALFSLLTELIFSLTGVDFATTAWSLAAALLLLVPMLAWLVKYLIPETDLRLEMMFLVNLIIAALGIVATVNGRTASAGTSEIEWGALAGVILILAAGLASGILFNQYLTHKKISKLQ